MVLRTSIYNSVRFLLALTLAFSLAVPYTEAATIVPDFTTQLSEHWTLNETSGKRTGCVQSYVMTDRNTVSSEAAIQGNGALFASASSESLDTADNASTSLTGNFAVAYWVDFNTLAAAGAYRATVGKFASTGTLRSYRILHSSNTTLMQNSSTGANVGTAAWSVALTTGTPYHMVFNYSTAGSSTWYVNGASQGTQTGLLTSIFDNASLTELGKNSSPNEYHLDGTLDEVSIWKGRTLSQIEIDTLYNSGAGIPCTATAADPEASPAQLYLKNADLYTKNGDLYKK